MASRVIRCDICNTVVHPCSWTDHLQGKRHLKLMALVISGKNENAAGEAQPTTSSVKSAPVNRLSPSSLQVKRGSSQVQHSNVKRQKLELENRQQPIPEIVQNQGPKHAWQPPRLAPINTNKAKQEHTFQLEKETYEKLCSLKTIDEQIDFLMKTFCMLPSDYAQRDNLCRMLENLIGEFFPGFTLTTYGSFANNLAMRGKSDVDVYLEFNFPTEDESPSEEETNKLKTILKTLSFIRYKDKQLFLNTVKGMKLRSLIQIVGAIIRKFGQGCQKVVCIPKAYCPIVKFYHAISKLNCDLSMNNRLALENTKLLLFYQSLDPRVHPLIFAIRFWAKCNKVCESNQGKISSYALSMLVVFYLQTCNPVILPTVHELQLIDTRQTIGWNYFFCQDATKIPKTKNKDSMDLLVKGFFAFYSTMDWTANVICPFNGKIVPKDKFLDENLNTNFKLNCLNIQDPFQLDRNIATSMTTRLSCVFIDTVSKTNNILTSETQSLATGIATTLNLNVEKKQPPPVPLPSKIATPPAKLQFCNGSTDFLILLNEAVLNNYPEIYKMKKFVIGDKRNFLMLARLSNIVRMIFEKVLKINCISVKKGSVTLKRQHNGSQYDVPSKVQILEHDKTKQTVLPIRKVENPATNLDVEIESATSSTTDFVCEVYHKTWINRKKFRRFLIKNYLPCSLLEGEEKISELIIESDGGTKSRKPIFVFDCSLIQLESVDKLGLRVKLGLAGSKEFTGHFVPFLQSFVGKIANQAYVSMPKITFPSSADINM